MALLRRGKNDGVCVYVPKETTLKELADKIKEAKSSSISFLT
jgi:hypothetical protein